MTGICAKATSRIDVKHPLRRRLFENKRITGVLFPDETRVYPIEDGEGLALSFRQKRRRPT
jgi:hypothetical protein